MRSACFALLLLLPSLAGADDAPAVSEDRPRIGLVLGGGGAKGASHIGVLQALDELRVPVDCVAGTSMGALVGGTFATGRDSDQIETLLRSIDWRRTVGGQGLRRETPINDKVSGAEAGNGFELGVNVDGLTAPSGLLASQEIEDVIRTLVRGAEGPMHFDELPIPFRAVATDLVEADMVVLDRGDLSLAMRASMAIPGAFSPVEVDGRVLADGGLTRNLPVDVARELCADVVIAVWVESPPPESASLDSALSLVDRSLEVMLIANERTQIQTLSDNDVGIAVPTGDMGVGDFLRAGEAIEFGHAAAMQQAEALRRYALGEDEYAAWREATLAPAMEAEARRLADIRIKGTDRVNPDYLKTHFVNVAVGNTVTEREISNDLRRLFALGDFERIEYRLFGPASTSELELRVTEKSWGPNFLRFDFGLATTGDEDLRALVRADHRRTWINRLGGQWHNALQLGQRSIFSTGIYQPLDIAQRFFVDVSGGYQNSLEDIFVGDDRVARYEFEDWFARAEVGINIGTRAQLRAGLQSGTTAAGIDTGPTTLDELGPIQDTHVVLSGIYDTRNDIQLPTNGSYVGLSYRRTSSQLGSEVDYTVIEGVWTQAFNYKGDSLSLIAGAGDTLDGTPPATRLFQLGGIRTFPGYRPGELRGQRYWYTGVSYARQLANLQPLFGQALYGGIRVSVGDMSERLDGLNADTLLGITGSLQGRTPLGAFLLSLSWLDDDRLTLQFSLGRPVAEGSLLDDIY